MGGRILLLVNEVRKNKKKFYLLLFYVIIVKFCSGVDMVALMQALSISDTIVDKLKDSSMGHYAITYMCYKIATPVRYTVTIGQYAIGFESGNNLKVSLITTCNSRQCNVYRKTTTKVTLHMNLSAADGSNEGKHF